MSLFLDLLDRNKAQLPLFGALLAWFAGCIAIFSIGFSNTPQWFIAGGLRFLGLDKWASQMRDAVLPPFLSHAAGENIAGQEWGLLALIRWLIVGIIIYYSFSMDTEWNTWEEIASRLFESRFALITLMLFAWYVQLSEINQYEINLWKFVGKVVTGCVLAAIIHTLRLRFCAVESSKQHFGLKFGFSLFLIPWGVLLMTLVVLPILFTFRILGTAGNYQQVGRSQLSH